MHSAYWFASVFTLAIGVGLVAGSRAVAADRPIVPDLELDALEEAVRWPHADVTAVMMLAGRLMAGRRDAKGLVYFRERAASEPGRGLFLALEGVFQARQADTVSVFQRMAWVNDAVAKLDRAVALEPGLPRYLRGIVLAGLPERFGKAQVAVDDLAWMLDNKDRFPIGLRRGAYYGLAQAYTTLGREAQARDALAGQGRRAWTPLSPCLSPISHSRHGMDSASGRRVSSSSRLASTSRRASISAISASSRRTPGSSPSTPERRKRPRARRCRRSAA